MSTVNTFSAFNGSNVLITGGLGFTGSSLARRLVQLGAKVTLVDSLIPQYGGNLFNIEDFKTQVVVNITDVRDPHAMAYLIQGQDFSTDRPGNQRFSSAINPRSLPSAQP
jgi:UDP-glucose 4-epimerase